MMKADFPLFFLKDFKLEWRRGGDLFSTKNSKVWEKFGKYLFFYGRKFSFWCTNRTIKKFNKVLMILYCMIIKYNIINTLFSLFNNMFPIS